MGDSLVAALDGVSLDIQAGEFTAVMGPSGSGKSTLIHCMAALDSPSAGQIVLGWCGHLAPAGQGAHQAAARQGGLRLPGVQLRTHAQCPREHRATARDRWAPRGPSMVRHRHRRRGSRATGCGIAPTSSPAANNSGWHVPAPSYPALRSFSPTSPPETWTPASREILSFLRMSVDHYHQTIVMVTHDPIAASYTDRVVFLADGKIVDELREPRPTAVLEKMRSASTRAAAAPDVGGLTMWRVSLRNLLARKLRLALSASPSSWGWHSSQGPSSSPTRSEARSTGSSRGTTADVEVTPERVIDVQSVGTDARTLPASLDASAPRPSRTPPRWPGPRRSRACSSSVPTASSWAGTAPPGLAFNYTDMTAITGVRILTLTQGRLPVGVDRDRPRRGHALGRPATSSGDTVTLATPGDPPVRRATLTGWCASARAGGLVGATLTIFDLRAIRELFFDGRSVYKRNLPACGRRCLAVQLRDEAATHPPGRGCEAQTGDKVAHDTQRSIEQVLGFINTFLLVFAGVAMVVGAFLIINTFSILVAQREARARPATRDGCHETAGERNCARSRRSWSASRIHVRDRPRLSARHRSEDAVRCHRPGSREAPACLSRSGPCWCRTPSA